jgi:hypothetical protein
MSSDSTAHIVAPSHRLAQHPCSAARKNSPVFYGPGFFGLTSTSQALACFYLCFCVDVLGLAAAMAAVVKIAYAIFDAVNDPPGSYFSENTRNRSAGAVRDDEMQLFRFAIDVTCVHQIRRGFTS